MLQRLGDPAYGWDKLVLFSIANKDSTEVENFPPLKNAGKRDSALKWKSN
jgi:hypothetical protein